MTSRRARRGAALVIGSVVLSGCAVGRPMNFAGRSNSFCSDALEIIAKLDAPTTPLRQIQFATDRYTAVEKTVSELTDSSLPGGSTGDQLRQRWLRPARASLDEGRSVLASLQQAVAHHEVSAASTLFSSAIGIGTAGVDTALLHAHGLGDCSTLFTPTPDPVQQSR